MRAKLSRLSSLAFTLDPFATPTTAMAPTYCSLRAGERCIANDGMCVSWRNQHVFLNHLWHLFHRVLRKIIEDAATGVLIIPHWPSKSWWPLVLRLRARWMYLPPPTFCVLPCTRHKTDPFAHSTTRLIALAFNGMRGGSVAQGLDRRRLRPPPALFSRYAQCVASAGCWTPRQHVARLCGEAQTLGGFLCAWGGATVSCVSFACPLLFGLFAGGRRCQSRQPTAVSFCHQLLAHRHGPFQTSG
jgi:hypothetical protein